jgi:hypothetical protein
MKFLKAIFILFITAVIITNVIPIISTWTWYYYTTKNGEFYFDQFDAKARDFAMMDRWWQHYKITKHPTDTVIYRTFKINPLKFWEWRQYFFSKKYRYPYINPTEIEKGPIKEYYQKKDKTTHNIGFLPACTLLASPINKIELVVGLGRKSS